MTIKTEDGVNKLLAAIRAKDVVKVRGALSEGCDPNIADRHGRTAFHEAVSSGSSSITLACLRRGGCPDIQDHLNGDGCLHIAAKNGYTKIVQMLLDNSANINLKNSNGETAEEVASSACKELLQRKRIEMLMSSTSLNNTDRLTKSYRDGSVIKLNPTRSASPKKKQEPISSSHESSTSLECASPSPGKIKLSFEFSRKPICLKVNILEIADLKLPTVHHFSHIYVKCRLIPDKDKETKGKTSAFKIDSDDQGYISRGSSASSQSSTGSYSSIDSDVIAEKIMSVWRKRPSRKNKDQVKSVLYSQDGDSTGRISFSIFESLSYDGLVLRKLNSIMAESKVHVRVCGRNRWTSKGTTIADAIIPFAIALKRTQTPQWFCLNYHIDVPITPEERKITQMNQSWEQKEGQHYTGRSLAWNMDFGSDSPDSSQPQTLYKSPSVPDCSRQRKHHGSKAARFLKGDLKIFKGKHNDRYNKNGKHMGSQMMENPGETSTVVENPRIEGLGCASSSANNNGLDSRISELFQVSKPDIEDPTDVRPLKYSRAFGEHSTGRSVRRGHTEDVSIEDVDEDFEQEPCQTISRHKGRPIRY